MKAIINSILAIILLQSCTKEIEVDLNSTNTKFVVEGEIPQNKTARVKITKTVNFSDSNNLPTVGGAKVSITDNLGIVEQLTETSKGVYESKKMVGEFGKTYTLNVQTEGNIFTSECTMPTFVKLNGLKSAISAARLPGSTKDNYIIFPEFIDPPTLGNNYQFIQSTSKETDTSILLANDNVGNGQPYTRPIFSREFEIVQGDVVTVEFRTIDKNVYNYFYTINAINNGGPGGGTTPSNPESNIKGGALGYFSVYTVQKMSVDVK